MWTQELEIACEETLAGTIPAELILDLERTRGNDADDGPLRREKDLVGRYGERADVQLPWTRRASYQGCRSLRTSVIISTSNLSGTVSYGRS